MNKQFSEYCIIVLSKSELLWSYLIRLSHYIHLYCVINLYSAPHWIQYNPTTVLV